MFLLYLFGLFLSGIIVSFIQVDSLCSDSVEIIHKIIKKETKVDNKILRTKLKRIVILANIIMYLIFAYGMFFKQSLFAVLTFILSVLYIYINIKTIKAKGKQGEQNFIDCLSHKDVIDPSDKDASMALMILFFIPTCGFKIGIEYILNQL